MEDAKINPTLNELLEYTAIFNAKLCYTLLT